MVLEVVEIIMETLTLIKAEAAVRLIQKLVDLALVMDQMVECL